MMLELFLLLSGPEYLPTELEIDLDAFFSLKSETSADAQEREFMQIYPGLARVLVAAGVPIVAPRDHLEKELLELAGVATAGTPDERATLRLEFSSPDFMKSIYRIHISVERPDGSFSALPAVSCGPDCLAPELATFLEQHRERILPLLRVPPPAPRVSAPPSDASDGGLKPERPRGSSGDFAQERHPASGPLWGAGAALGTVGLGAALWGGVGYLRQRASDRERDIFVMDRSRYFNTDRQVLFGVGVGLVAAGLTMVLVDRLALTKKRRSRLTAHAGPGLSLSF